MRKVSKSAQSMITCKNRMLADLVISIQSWTDPEHSVHYPPPPFILES